MLVRVALVSEFVDFDELLVEGLPRFIELTLQLTQLLNIAAGLGLLMLLIWVLHLHWLELLLLQGLELVIILLHLRKIIIITFIIRRYLIVAILIWKLLIRIHI